MYLTNIRLSVLLPEVNPKHDSELNLLALETVGIRIRRRQARQVRLESLRLPS
jgi:hypothetical protein